MGRRVRFKVESPVRIGKAKHVSTFGTDKKVIAVGMVNTNDIGSETEQIREAVQAHYGAVAERGATACGPDTTDGATSCGANDSGLYDVDELNSLTPEAAAASAGCGNPTALGDLRPGETVVDLGSGGGIDCFLAAKAVGESGSVIGIDMTKKMIDLARANAFKMNADNVVFHLAPIEAIPMPDQQADVVISNCVLALVPDKGRVFDEAFRVLKPGGRMFISDMVTVGALPPDVLDDAKRWVECVGGAEDREKYLATIKRSGFEPIEVLEDSEPSVRDDDQWGGSVHSVTIKAIRPE
jgi:SAM-dependent methyltransferase